MLKQRTPLPGFGLSLGITVFYLGVMVLLPLAALFATSGALPWESNNVAAGSGLALAAFRLTVGTSALAAALNVFFGGLTAWALVRYRFPGKKIIDGLIDLPFALPTAVAGITLTELCAPTGWLGRPLAALGLPVAFSRAGIVIALVFIGLPFVVRTLQPVLEDMDRDMEEAASTLGAGRWQIFRRVVFPPLVPALLTGFAALQPEYASLTRIALPTPQVDVGKTRAQLIQARTPHGDRHRLAAGKPWRLAPGTL